MTEHVKRDCRCVRSRHVHGSRQAYLRDRCRCLPCRLANHWALQSYASGGTWRETEDNYVPRRGMRLRLQALAAIGYSARQLSEHTGLPISYLQNLRTDNIHPLVGARTALIVAQVYETLWDKPPSGADADRQRSRARRYGYKVPMDLDDDTIDDPSFGSALHEVIRSGLDRKVLRSHGKSPNPADEVAIERAIRGRQVRLTKTERSEATRKMTNMGYTAKEIAERLGVDPRSIVRYRTRQRTEDAA